MAKPTKKLNLALIFGGRSAERDVSVMSAENIAKAADKSKYNLILIHIDRNGRWFYLDNPNFSGGFSLKSLAFKKRKEVFICPGVKLAWLFDLKTGRRLKSIDIAFPIVHGTFGEDGSLQGLLKMVNVPFVGAGVLGSAVGMDKDVMKRILKEANIPIADFLVFGADSRKNIDFREIKKRLGVPLFVKPVNLGSSVGISKVENEKEFKLAAKEAFRYDDKIIIEEYINGRELECSVLGNENPTASALGEIVLQRDFYSYQAKYIDEDGALLKAPAEITPSIVKKLQVLAVRVFKVLNCEGMARVDFFLKNNKKIIVNEINTIPGFTEISMYPKLWSLSGISFKKLIDKLVALALERFEKDCNFII